MGKRQETGDGFGLLPVHIYYHTSSSLVLVLYRLVDEHLLLVGFLTSWKELVIINVCMPYPFHDLLEESVKH
jgi:hypothetical protein